MQNMKFFEPRGGRGGLGSQCRREFHAIARGHEIALGEQKKYYNQFWSQHEDGRCINCCGPDEFS